MLSCPREACSPPQGSWLVEGSAFFQWYRSSVTGQLGKVHALGVQESKGSLQGWEKPLSCHSITLTRLLNGYTGHQINGYIHVQMRPLLHLYECCNQKTKTKTPAMIEEHGSVCTYDILIVLLSNFLVCMLCDLLRSLWTFFEKHLLSEN